MSAAPRGPRRLLTFDYSLLNNMYGADTQQEILDQNPSFPFDNRPFHVQGKARHDFKARVFILNLEFPVFL